MTSPFSRFANSRAFIRFLRPFFSLRFWKLNYRTLQIKAAKRAWSRPPYADYLQFYYSKNVNPFYETIEDKWASIRPIMIEMADLKPGDRVLDLGTGVGFQAAAYAGRGHNTVGVDFVLDRLRLAHKKHTLAHMDWTLADATCLPFPNNAFEVITISLVLHAMPIDTIRFALSEIRRVAARRIVFAEPRMPDHWLYGRIYKQIVPLFDESIYMRDYLETDFEILLKTVPLRLIEWRWCAHHTLAAYACEV